MMAGLKQKSETISKIEIYHKKTDSEVFNVNTSVALTLNTATPENKQGTSALLIIIPHNIITENERIIKFIHNYITGYATQMSVNNKTYFRMSIRRVCWKAGVVNW